MEKLGTKTILDNLIAGKKIEPVITVFVPPWHGPRDLKNYPDGDEAPPGYSKDMRMEEYGCNAAVAQDLAVTLPNAMRAQFNVTSDREHTTISGYSMGGLQATFTALSHPEVFGNVIAQSPAFWWSPPNKEGVQEGGEWLKNKIFH